MSLKLVFLGKLAVVAVMPFENHVNQAAQQKNADRRSQNRQPQTQSNMHRTLPLESKALIPSAAPQRYT